MPEEEPVPEQTGQAPSLQPEEGKAEAAEAPSAPETEVAGLRRELEAVQKEKSELFERLRYLQADFENFRKRAAREAEALIRYANEALVARLLPVLDDFDAALASVAGDAGKGIQMIHENLLRVLKEAGLQEIPAQGQTFDPYLHECVQQVPDAGLPDGSVKEVVRKGYCLQDRILRPAQVVVVRNGGERNA